MKLRFYSLSAVPPDHTLDSPHLEDSLTTPLPTTSPHKEFASSAGTLSWQNNFLPVAQDLLARIKAAHHTISTPTSSSS